MDERARIACLHAHHGNIGYIDLLLAPYRAEAAHFVDPALVRRIGVDHHFSAEQAADRVRGQLRWIAESDVDGIIVTCTAYAASMPLLGIAGITIPIVTIDEPFFAAISRAPNPQRILFTNAGTVEGTTRRLAEYADRHGARIAPRADLIPGAFDLFMAGRQNEHDALLTDRLLERARTLTDGSLFAGQLSMAASAREAARRSGVRILSPLDTLESALVTEFGLLRNDDMTSGATA